MTKDIQLLPGDIVTVTDYDGHPPVACDKFHATFFMPSRNEYEVTCDNGISVSVKKVESSYGCTIEIPKIFLQLKESVKDRKKIQIRDLGKVINILRFDAVHLTYYELASISKSTPVELLNQVIQMLQKP